MSASRASGIEALLQSKDCTLESLLGEDELLTEVTNQNTALLS